MITCAVILCNTTHTVSRIATYLMPLALAASPSTPKGSQGK